MLRADYEPPKNILISLSFYFIILSREIYYMHDPDICNNNAE